MHKHSCFSTSWLIFTLTLAVFLFFFIVAVLFGGFPWWFRWEGIHLQCQRPEFDPCFGKIPWRRAWQPTPVFLPGESHGQRSLAAYSPWGHKELDTSEWLTQHRLPEHTTGFPGGSAIENPPANAGDRGSIPGWGKSPGEGNGSPLQDSCLENPREA